MNERRGERWEGWERKGKDIGVLEFFYASGWFIMYEAKDTVVVVMVLLYLRFLRAEWREDIIFLLRALLEEFLLWCSERLT